MRPGRDGKRRGCIFAVMVPIVVVPPPPRACLQFREVRLWHLIPRLLELVNLARLSGEQSKTNGRFWRYQEDRRLEYGN